MDGAPLENLDADANWEDQPFGAPMPRAFRLVDAERIAAQRLDGAAEGSLKEALATVIVTPDTESSSLGERLQKFATEAPALPVGLDAKTAQPAFAMPDVDFGWFGAVPPAHAVPCFEERDFGDLPLQHAAVETADMTASQPVAIAETVERAAADFPAHVQAEEPQAVLPHDETRDAPQDGVHIAAHKPAPQETFDASTSEPAATASQPTEAVAPIETPLAVLPPPVPPPVLPEDPNLEPIVTAYAASARLAADAAAASQALFELQKLLNEQMLEASPELNDAMEAHAFAALESIPVAQQSAAAVASAPEPSPETRTKAQDPVTDVNLIPPRLVQARTAAPPPPLPAPAYAVPAADPARRMPPQERAAAPPPVRTQAGHSSQGAGKRPAQPKEQSRKPQRRPAPSSRPRRATSAFDFRGFAAGFALSGAIGIVLYFVMATG